MDVQARHLWGGCEQESRVTHGYEFARDLDHGAVSYRGVAVWPLAGTATGSYGAKRPEPLRTRAATRALNAYSRELAEG